MLLCCRQPRYVLIMKIGGELQIIVLGHLTFAYLLLSTNAAVFGLLL